MPRKSILLVDDDAFIRDVIKSALNNDYHVFEASTYLDVMKFPFQSVDLAIVDYILPDRDGFEVLQSLRERNPSLPAIIITGWGDEDVIIRALHSSEILRSNQATGFSSDDVASQPRRRASSGIDPPPENGSKTC